MSDRLGFLSVTGAVFAGAALLIVAMWTLFGGPALFSPGGLNAVAKTQTLGGVTSHAQLGGRCEACHTAPWSPQTMSERCLACHADVNTQIQGHNGLHGGLVGAMASPTCQTCHSDHRGPNGALSSNFDHNRLAFKLIGKHAVVPCDRCHTSVRSLQDMRNTPQDCYSCHAKDDKHGGTFGRLCGQCHTPASWANASFDHKVFPVNHGNDREASTCATCHPNGVSTYTCYGCHQHTTASVQSDHEGQNVAALADCVRCHVGGRRMDN